MKKKDFWNKQYKKPTHLALSSEPSEDLIKFTRWLQREHGRAVLNVTALVVDLGCGNGRNLLYLAREFGVHGVGYDTSHEALREGRARTDAEELPLVFEERSIAKPIPLEDVSAALALDMMSSHVLRRVERESLRAEILRVLRPNGWLFFKSFFLDEDRNAARMLRDYPGPEEGMYVHPEIGVPEYVWTASALRIFFEPSFVMHKMETSHKHLTKRGEPWKRRTVSLYLEKSGGA
ncbi:MAG: class I SAM-dependent methyltransferase [Patescibacteria group bacterium]